MFREAEPEKALQVSDQLGILEAIHPGLVVDDWLVERIKLLRTDLVDTPWAGVKPVTAHYLALMTFWLARDELDDLMERLNLRSDQRKVLRDSNKIRFEKGAIATAKKASDLYRLLASTTDDARMIAWLALKDEDDRVCEQLIRFEIELREIAPIIDGNYLKTELKLKPDPIFRTILDTLRDARLDGLVNTLEDERAIVDRILVEYKPE
jgi:hypothetical protein